MQRFSAKIEIDTFFSVSEQTELFLLAVLMGCVFGLIYDVFRALRAAVPVMKREVPTAVCDVLFMLICGLGIFVFSLVFARGEIRAYYWLGAFLGAVIYIMTAGNVIIGIIRWFFGGVYRIVNKICTWISDKIKQTVLKIRKKNDYKFVSNDKILSPNCKK